jgi:hypothetical protein
MAQPDADPPRAERMIEDKAENENAARWAAFSFQQPEGRPT